MQRDAIGPHICECGHGLETGIAVLLPAAFPDQRRLYEDIALRASPLARCPQCGLPNEHQELAATLIFHPGKKFFIQMAKSANATVVEETERLVSGLGDSDWTTEVTRDPDEFRTRALGAIIGLIAPIPFNELQPAFERDFTYHAALLTVTRPGLLQVHPNQDLSDEELTQALHEARLEQIANSFVSTFADADVAAIDPADEIADLFPPECFEDESIAQLQAIIEAGASQGLDVTSMRAGLAAAARHGGLPAPPGIDLARDLVQRALKGATFQQDPQTWAPLLSPGDIHSALWTEAPPQSEDELQLLFGIATTFGHGEAVAELTMKRSRLSGLTEDSLEDAIERVLGAADKRLAEDTTLGSAISQFARLDDLDLAVHAMWILVDRLIEDRPTAVVGIVQEIAARLKNEGEAARALEVLDQVEPRFPLNALSPPEQSRLINERGNVLRELHRVEDALQAYQLAIAVHPGDVKDPQLRVALINGARMLRDAGLLQRSLDAFAEILPHTEGEQRFECLFGTAISHQRAGDWQAAQKQFDEAFEFVGSLPMSDQVVRFATAASFNARILGLPERVTQSALREAVEASDSVTDRQKLIMLAITATHGLESLSGDEPPEDMLDELRREMLKAARSLNLPALADDDPEFALAWLPVARLAGDEELARGTVEALLTNDRMPVIALRAACIGAEIACEAADWTSGLNFAERAIEMAASIAAEGSEGTMSLEIAETLGEVHRLGAAISPAPAEPEYETLASRIADTQCSLLLSLQLGGPGVDREPIEPESPQVLQWLSAGEAQIPILTRTVGGRRESKRGLPLETALAVGLGERIAGRVTRSPALAEGDLVDEVEQYRPFREAFIGSVSSLDLQPTQPLTIVPSTVLTGVPLHHALGEYFDVAYAPNLAIAASLSQRASETAVTATAVAEVSCTCFNDEIAIVEALRAGSEALAELCGQRKTAEFRHVGGLEATATAVGAVLADADIVKLSCHGVANATLGRFALVLSDGTQLPPPVADISARADLAERYLFDWSDSSERAERCRLVVSSACASGSGLTTGGGEQVGLARAYLSSGVLSFVAPLWPVAAGPAQEFANAFIDECLASPGQPIATTLRRVQLALAHLPLRVRDAFVLHGHAGPLFQQPNGGTE